MGVTGGGLCATDGSGPEAMDVFGVQWNFRRAPGKRKGQDKGAQSHKAGALSSAPIPQ